MGLNEMRALMHKRTGLVPEEGSHVPVKLSGPKAKRPIPRGKSLRQRTNEELDHWFGAIAKVEGGDCQCWECGSRIPDAVLRHGTAHIMPKAMFPSVATHPYNYIMLGAHCCHDQSHRVDTFSKMNIFREAVERFLEFDPLILPEEKRQDYYTLFVETAKAAFPDLFPKPSIKQTTQHA
jgi:hypothetical protein